MSLNDSLRLIEEIKKQHLAIGGAALAGLGLTGLAADNGYLGHDAQEQMTAINGSLRAARQGYSLGADEYDRANPDGNFIGRGMEGLRIANIVGRGAYTGIRGMQSARDEILKQYDHFNTLSKSN